jgi:hypothetical protein
MMGAAITSLLLPILALLAILPHYPYLSQATTPQTCTPRERLMRLARER